MSSYQLSGGAWVVRLADNSRLSPGGEGWSEYQTWLTDGGVPLPPSAELLAETRRDLAPLTPSQIRLALTAAGLRVAVEAAVAAAVAAGDSDLDDYWRHSPVFHRCHPLVATMIAALGVTDEQADELWRAGALL